MSLINSSGYYFLSRPCCFGKSLFLDTLKDIFEAKKGLFEGLYIEDKADLNIRILAILGNNKKSLNIDCQQQNHTQKCFN